ncbi:hypothetical protein Nepgr_003774 [Nepenthes gracilis]|uniref:Uncharacterized protein n=1 Tax=Nepenthes gracilis TaxID=150966 RepID=A0AAD3XEB7_NEPGR|nr:hypothetical protein Nepgr_003774 [Nepenthes gracilis]
MGMNAGVTYEIWFLLLRYSVMESSHPASPHHTGFRNGSPPPSIFSICALRGFHTCSSFRAMETRSLLRSAAEGLQFLLSAKARR